jgi:hypothetical protein
MKNILSFGTLGFVSLSLMIATATGCAAEVQSADTTDSNINAKGAQTSTIYVYSEKGARIGTLSELLTHQGKFASSLDGEFGNPVGELLTGLGLLVVEGVIWLGNAASNIRIGPIGGFGSREEATQTQRYLKQETTTRFAPAADWARSVNHTGACSGITSGATNGIYINVAVNNTNCRPEDEGKKCAGAFYTGTPGWLKSFCSCSGEIWQDCITAGLGTVLGRGGN